MAIQGSQHAVPGCTRDEVLDGYRYGSRHRNDASRSRSCDDAFRSRSRSMHHDDAYMSRHLDDSFRLSNGRWALPLPPAGKY
ncbi:hypothetical protein ILYODFUR_029857 [Ilyodon furcidens]|uniref:Uncharacterized protein n=1 Tax=Ilyodon furcidens TaxID=33524 RepID=A0ABV0T1C7_9TELE